MPKLCMTRTINLSNAQFRYQLVFFIRIYGYIWLTEGCLWHLLPRQNLPSGKTCVAVCFTWLHESLNTTCSRRSVENSTYLDREPSCIIFQSEIGTLYNCFDNTKKYFCEIIWNLLNCYPGLQK